MNALYQECEGSGPELVLLHGWGLNLRVFDGLRQSLARSHRVLAVDLPGHGRSPWPQGLDAAGFYAAVRACIRPGARLLGWSLGGQLALRLAAEPALAIQALALFHTTPCFQVREHWAHGLSEAQLGQFERALALAPEQCVKDFLALQVRGSAQAAGVLGVLGQALDTHGRAVPAALALGLALLRTQDLRTLAGQIRVPAFIVGGQSDRVTPPAAQQALAAMLPHGAAPLILRRAGHAGFLSHSVAVLSGLEALWAQLAPAPGAAHGQ